jgi:hypothetical protein
VVALARRLSLVILLWCLSAHAAPSDGIAGSVGAIYLFPSGMAGSLFGHDADANLFHDQGDNVWWKRNWAAFDAAKARDVARLREQFGTDARILLHVYFPVYLADPVHGDVYLERLATVLEWFDDAGIETALFLGRPEFDGAGRASDYHDVVHDATARAKLLAMIARVLDAPRVAARVRLVSVYYLGLTPPAQLAFTESEILAYNQAIRATINARGMQYLQHVDGPFWEHQAAANPNGGTWYQNGYTPANIGVDSGAADYLFAESWAQGTLRAGIARLVAEGRFPRDRILLVNDVPNCDDAAVVAADPGFDCSGWPEIRNVQGNNAYWFDCFRKSGLSAWAVWAYADAALDDINPYGSVDAAGASLTAKAIAQRGHVATAFQVFADDLENVAPPPFGPDLCGPP